MLPRTTRGPLCGPCQLWDVQPPKTSTIASYRVVFHFQDESTAASTAATRASAMSVDAPGAVRSAPSLPGAPLGAGSLLFPALLPSLLPPPSLLTCEESLCVRAWTPLLASADGLAATNSGKAFLNAGLHSERLAHVKKLTARGGGTPCAPHNTLSALQHHLQVSLSNQAVHASLEAGCCLPCVSLLRRLLTS